MKANCVFLFSTFSREAEQKQYTHDIITMHNDMVDEEAKIRETENEIAADLELVRKSLAEALVKEDIVSQFCSVSLKYIHFFDNFRNWSKHKTVVFVS